MILARIKIQHTIISHLKETPSRMQLAQAGVTLLTSRLYIPRQTVYVCMRFNVNVQIQNKIYAYTIREVKMGSFQLNIAFMSINYMHKVCIDSSLHGILSSCILLNFAHAYCSVQLLTGI